jgi:tetratricopeptide (TPR) repeat protein
MLYVHRVRRAVRPAAVLLALLLPATAPPTLGAQELPAAERALAEGRLDEAVELYRAAAAERPDDPATLALLGRTLALADRYGEASEVLTRAVDRGAGDVRTLLYLGSALWESGDPEAADPVLERAALAAEEVAAGTPTELLARQQLGRLRLWSGRPEEAIPSLERALALRPTAVDLRLDLARAQDGAGRAEDAVAAYRRVIEIAPDSHHARWGLAQVLARTGRRDEAAEELRIYQELYDADQDRTRRIRRIESLVDQARSLALAGDHAGAAEALEAAVALDPDDEALRRLLARERMAGQSADP